MPNCLEVIGGAPTKATCAYCATAYCGRCWSAQMSAQCVSCEAIYCANCTAQIGNCACGKNVCPQCDVVCNTCGNHACRDCSQKCTGCNTPFHVGCFNGADCSACDTILCGTCATRTCPNGNCNEVFHSACWANSSRSCQVCSNAGCWHCMTFCKTCETAFDPNCWDDTLECVWCDDDLCESCRTPCNNCNEEWHTDCLAHEQGTCNACNNDCCGDCGVRCPHCKTWFHTVNCWDNHSQSCSDCGVNYCTIANNPTCLTTCSGLLCGSYCPACWNFQRHFCTVCGQERCADCWSNKDKCPNGCDDVPKQITDTAATATKFKQAATVAKCTSKRKKKAAEHFARVDPSKYRTSIVRNTIDPIKAKRIWDGLTKLDALNELEDPTLKPGRCSKGLVPVKAHKAGSTTTEEREAMQTLKRDGQANVMCHTCCTTDPAGPDQYGFWIADHQPSRGLQKLLQTTTVLNFANLDLAAYPTYSADQFATRYATLTADIGNIPNAFRLYPHCGKCSLEQSSLIRVIRMQISEVVKRRTAFTNNPSIANCDNLRAGYDRLEELFNDSFNKKLIRKVAHDNNASTPGSDREANQNERDAVQVIGGQTQANNANGTGCHSCGELNPKTNARWIADHQPASILVATGMAQSPQYLYPQCIKCESQQSTAARKIKTRWLDNQNI